MARTKSKLPDGKTPITDWRAAFFDFLNNLTINSKETGLTNLGSALYDSQRHVVGEIADGLKEGIHWFDVLKFRQAGITTVTLAIDLFWCFQFPGTQGSLIADSGENSAMFREVLTQYINNLPKSHRIRVVTNNRNFISFANGSVLNFLVAAGKGKLGVGKGLSFVHATEISSWPNEGDVKALTSAMAETNPNRLFIFESTARGFNLWHDMWQESLNSVTRKPIFIGWYQKEAYRKERGSPEFRKFATPLTEEESKRVEKVKQETGYKITAEQMAWFRWKTAELLGDERKMDEDYPWIPEDAFVASGASFFRQNMIKARQEIVRKLPFSGYRYTTGDNFLALQIEQVERLHEVTLRVWEEPHPRGIYVVGADPAYGDSDLADNFVISIWRAYSDCLVQVAEFCTQDIEAHQFAWILVHLLGAYKEVYLNLEVTGPGTNVLLEIRHIRQLLQSPVVRKEAAARGLMNILGNMRSYLHHRPDSIGGQYAFHTRMTYEVKRTILSQMSDSLALNHMHFRSLPLLTEMRTIVRGEGTIGAAGKGKDDRVMAAALANRQWIDWVRPSLLTQGRTLAAETEADKKGESGGRYENAVAYAVGSYFQQRQEERKQQILLAGIDDDGVPDLGDEGDDGYGGDDLDYAEADDAGY